jgi:hypothetical protein
MRRARTTRWSPFPPRARGAQLDEKWAFVAKEQANRGPADPADAREGDRRDHVALDPDHRPVVCVVPGQRPAESTPALARDSRRRTSGRLMDPIATDEYAPYRGAILGAYGEVVIPPRSGERGRPGKASKVPPAGLTSATAHKTRAKGRVVKVEQRVIFGAAEAVGAALARPASSRAIDTSFVERQDGTDRDRDARKVRKSYRFSKDRSVPRAITYFTMYSDDFCWAARSLRVEGGDGRWRRRTPAMAAGLADHIWPLSEWLTLPAVHRK